MMMGYREYSRHRGVTLRAVQKAIEAGRIVVTVDKKIDSVVADRDWDANTDASRVAVAITKKKSNASALAATEGGGSDDDEVGDFASDKTAIRYREHRATREEFQAKKQELEYNQLAGLVINVDDARRIAYTSFRVLRDAVLNVAPRIKDQLAAESDAHACEQLLEAELVAALQSVDIAKLLVDQDERDGS